jgi:hypothetical protein
MRTDPTPSLFGDPVEAAGPYRETVPDVRATAALGDLDTSRQAAERMNASGATGRNAAVVLALVCRHPGSTSVELFEAQGFGSDLDRHEISRRLADLERAGRVHKGPVRDCRVKLTPMVTWHATEATR